MKRRFVGVFVVASLVFGVFDSLPGTRGRAAAASTVVATSAGGVTYQEDSRPASFLWRKTKRRGAYGGSYRTEHLRGARAVFYFWGSAVTWYTRVGPNQGTASVYVDGDRVAVVNNYASAVRERKARTFRGFSSGRHRLVIVVRGEKGSPAGTGTWIGVDAFRDGGEVVNGETYRWQRVRARRASGDRYARANARRARASFTFRGKGVDWYTVTGPRQGKARIYVDGVLRKTVDNYAAEPRYGVRRSIAGLTDAVHTITVAVLGERNPASRGTFVAVDKWVIRLPSRVAFKRLGAWVDVFDYSALDPAQAIAAMDARGVRTLYIQTARYSSGNDFYDAGELGEWVERAHAAGMRVVGWYLPAYDQYLDRDVRRTAAIAKFRSPNGHRIDALAIDIEYKGATESLDEYNEGIKAHIRRVRRAVGNRYPIGAITLSPVGMALYPSSHAGFPWETLGRYADVVLPMGYWSYRKQDGRCSADPKYCAYQYSRDNIRLARKYTGLAVHLIGGVGNAVTADEVADFVGGARDQNAYGGSLYDYRTTRSSFWSSLGKLNLL